MFIPTKSPKSTQELQPTTKTTSPLAKHEAAQTTLLPAGQLSMWALQNYTDWRTTKQNAMGKHFCGISCFLNNVFGIVSVSTKEGDAI